MTDDASPSQSNTSISGGVNLAAEHIDIGGDVVGRDKIIQNIQHLYERALTAAEEAERAQSIEARSLAQGVGHLAQRLQARAQDATSTSSGSPYRGLLEYRLNDAEIFVGRDRAIYEVLQHTASGPLTVLHSESGAGKTSLLQAGLAPRLIGKGHLPLYVRPYDADPTLKIKREILSDPGQAPLLAIAPLRDFLRQVTGVLGPQATLYVLLDQFEEFFTRLDEAPRTEFIRELAECLDDASLNVRWVLAIRSEYFGNLANFRPRIRNPYENDYRLNRLTRDEALLVIQQPAEARGIHFEDGLIDRLLDDLGKIDIAPPQLQLVCATLYEDLDPGEKSITQARYNREGGAAGILRSHLERVLSRDLRPEQRPVARRLLESLISSEQQRIIRTHTELIAELSAHGVTPQTLDVILTQLTDSRLLKVDETADGLAYELAHDYLLSEIKLDPDVQARKAAHELLEQEVRAYRRYKTLLTAERLQVIEPYVTDWQLTLESQQLLDDSRAAVQREHAEEEARRQKELDDARRLAEETEARRLVEAERRQDAEQAALRLKTRNRIITAAVVAAGLLAILSGVFGVQSDQAANANATLAAQKAEIASTAQAAEAEALAQRDEAQRQARIARSRELAAQALSHVDDQWDLALLLSVEAYQAIDTAEAHNSLLSSLQHSSRIQSVLQSHASYSVYSAAFSPDGKTLAAGSGDGTIILWDMSNPQAPQRLGAPLTGHTAGIVAMAFSHDGKTLASGSNDQTIILWDVTDPQAARRWGEPLTGRADFLSSVAFSPDGKILASGGCGNYDVNVRHGDCIQGEISLWDVSKPQAAQRLGEPITAHTDAVADVVFSPNGTTLASAGCGERDSNGACTQGEIILWDVSNPYAAQRLGKPLTSHLKSVASVAFSPDGKTLASGSRDETIILWDISEVTAPQPLGVPLTGHDAGVSSVAFSRDGKTLASGGGDKKIILWDVSNPKAPFRLGVPLIGHIDSVYSVAFGPDGKTLASSSSDNVIILWDVSETTAPLRLGAPFTGHTAAVISMAFSPDGKTLASGSWDKTIILWDMTNLQTPKPLGAPFTFHTDSSVAFGVDVSVAFSPDGKLLASGNCLEWGRDNNCTQSRITLLDVSNPQAPQRLGESIRYNGKVTSVAFSPDRKTLALSGSEIVLWDVSNPRTPLRLGELLGGHTGYVNSVAFSPDGKTLASGSFDNTIILWDVSNLRTPLRIGKPLIGHKGSVKSVAFSSDGTLVASSSDDATVILWDVSNLHTPQSSGVLLTPAGSSVAFSSDGKTLASSSFSTISLWDISNPRAPHLLGAPLASRSDTIHTMAFTPDGKTLASGSGDGAITLWNVDPVSWQARACQIARRNLTRAEWQQYMGNEPYRKTCEQWPLELEATPTRIPTPIP